MNHPFTAIPHAAPGVETRREDRGGVQLRQAMPEARGLKGWMARTLGMARFRRLDLDERGAVFWELIDGSRDLAEIENALRKRFGFDEAESRDAVILFTKMLMRRGWIALDLQAGRPPNQTPPTPTMP